jgi:hypothetical protein
MVWIRNASKTGFTIGLSEMLFFLQSHDGKILLSPAFPSVRHKGSVSGLKAKG